MGLWLIIDVLLVLIVCAPGLWSDGYRGLSWPNPGRYPASLSPQPPPAWSSRRTFVNVNSARVFPPALVVLKRVRCLLQVLCACLNCTAMLAKHILLNFCCELDETQGEKISWKAHSSPWNQMKMIYFELRTLRFCFQCFHFPQKWVQYVL